MKKCLGYVIKPQARKEPKLDYEPGTGFVFLSDGHSRQIILRVGSDKLYLYWKKGKCEIPIYLDKLLEAIHKA